jgi:hypothetical protein
MILKISTESGWRFMDNVEDVFVHQDTVKNIIGQGNDCPTQWMDEHKNLPREELVELYKCFTISKNGELFKRIVIKNNIVYLLNDENKTIERLN